jgi:succinoglycan biosynthesis protein ExoU
VDVVIAAFNAERTIERAIRSALEQAETARVIVVDDGSTDGTVAAISRCLDPQGRLICLRQPNRGPSAARNRGLEAVTAAAWCLLDADDAFAPGRIQALLDAAPPAWDLLADGVTFLHADGRADILRAADGLARRLTFSEFVRRNIARRNAPRQELGFLQPLMRTAFFRSQDLRFSEELRFAEDYILCARALAAGAVFILAPGAGYHAHVQPGSLSQAHRPEDYDALIAADRVLKATPGLTKADRRAVTAHIHLQRLKRGHLSVEAALARGHRLAALRLMLADPHSLGFAFNHRLRPRLSRHLKRLARRAA